jgi:hypothetical protein
MPPEPAGWKPAPRSLADLNRHFAKRQRRDPIRPEQQVQPVPVLPERLLVKAEG